MLFSVQTSGVYTILTVMESHLDHGGFMELRTLIREKLDAPGSYLIVNMAQVASVDPGTLLDIASISRRFEEYVGFLFFTHVPAVILEQIPDLAPFAMTNDKETIALIETEIKKLNDL